ncbi:DUF2158 domain-containing protein [Massilia horti]|nr:DUF2158 domain-containing protein [Massilia horti]
MAGEFEVGDTVQLKSGGDVMTVEKMESETVTCVWMQEKKVMRDTFVRATLEKFTPAW